MNESIDSSVESSNDYDITEHVLYESLEWILLVRHDNIFVCKSINSSEHLCRNFFIIRGTWEYFEKKETLVLIPKGYGGIAFLNDYSLKPIIVQNEINFIDSRFHITNFKMHKSELEINFWDSNNLSTGNMGYNEFENIHNFILNNDKNTLSKLLTSIYFSSDDEFSNQINILKAANSKTFILGIFPEYIRNDEEICLKSIMANCTNYCFVYPSIKYDKKIISYVLKLSPMMITHVPVEILKNKKFLLEKLEENISFLDHLPSNITFDKSLTLEIAEKFGKVSIHSSWAILEDKELIMKLIDKVKNLEELYQLLSSELAEDKEVIFKFLKNGMTNFDSLFYSLRSDKEIAIEFIKVKSDNIYLIDDSLKDDQELFDIAMNTNNFSKSVPYDFIINSKFLTDKNFALKCMKYFKKSFVALPDNLKRDKDIIIAFLENLKSNGEISYLLPNSITNMDIALDALKRKLEILPYLSKRLKKNLTVVISALQNNYNSAKDNFDLGIIQKFEVVEQVLRYDEDIVHDLDFTMFDKQQIMKIFEIDLRRPHFIYEKLSEHMQEDKDISMAFIKCCTVTFGDELNLIPGSLRMDIDIVREALKKDGRNLVFLPERFHNNRELILLAFKSKQSTWIEYGKYIKIIEITNLLPKYKNDKEIALLSVKYGDNLTYFSDELRDDKQVALAMFDNSMKKIYNINNNSIESLSRRLRDDIEVILAAVKKNAVNFNFASKRLQADKQILLEALKSAEHIYTNENIECKLEESYIDSEFLKDNEIKLLVYKLNLKVNIP